MDPITQGPESYLSHYKEGEMIYLLTAPHSMLYDKEEMNIYDYIITEWRLVTPKQVTTHCMRQLKHSRCVSSWFYPTHVPNMCSHYCFNISMSMTSETWSSTNTRANLIFICVLTWIRLL